MSAAIFAVVLAVLLFCAYKVNTNPSGSALTGFIFACTALVVIALNTKIDVVFQTLRDELEPRTGTSSGSVNAVEPYRQRSQREDLEQSLVHALAPGLLNRMDGKGVGEFIRATADAILSDCPAVTKALCTCRPNEGCSNCPSRGDKRIQAAMDGAQECAARVARVWEENLRVTQGSRAQRGDSSLA